MHSGGVLGTWRQGQEGRKPICNTTNAWFRFKLPGFYMAVQHVIYSNLAGTCPELGLKLDSMSLSTSLVLHSNDNIRCFGMFLLSTRSIRPRVGLRRGRAAFVACFGPAVVVSRRQTQTKKDMSIAVGSSYSLPLALFSLWTSSLSFLSVACSESGNWSVLTLSSVLRFPPLLKRVTELLNGRRGWSLARRVCSAGREATWREKLRNLDGDMIALIGTLLFC